VWHCVLLVAGQLADKPNQTTESRTGQLTETGVNSWTGQFADWSTRGYWGQIADTEVNSRTGQLTDWTVRGLINSQILGSNRGLQDDWRTGWSTE